MMVKSGTKLATSSSVSGLMNMFLAKWCCQASSVMMRTFFRDLGLVPQYPSNTYLLHVRDHIQGSRLGPSRGGNKGRGLPNLDQYLVSFVNISLWSRFEHLRVPAAGTWATRRHTNGPFFGCSCTRKRYRRCSHDRSFLPTPKIRVSEQFYADYVRVVTRTNI